MELYEEPAILTVGLSFKSRDGQAWPQSAIQLNLKWNFGATCGVTVSMSAFLACHQCYCAGSSLAWGLNLWALVCSIFWNSSPEVFSGYSCFIPSFIGLWFSQLNKAKRNEIYTLSKFIAELSLRTTWHVTHVARDKRSMCCTWFVHDWAWATWTYVLETVRGAVRRL